MNLNKPNRRAPTPPLKELRKDFSLHRNKKYLIIEGTDLSNDSKVYNAVVDNNCQLQPSGGKNEILEEFSITYDNQIAIVDKDYDDSIKINKVYYTDYNDIECTAINIIDDSNKIFDSLQIDGMTREDFKNKVYEKVLDLACTVSSINKYIYNYNQEFDKKYKYILKFFINNDDDEKISIGDVKKINTIISKKNNIKIDAIVGIYKNEYRDFTISEKDFLEYIESNKNNSFRGHDFFIILSYLIDYYNLIISKDLDDNFKKNPSVFLEERFIKYFSKTKRIMESNLYDNIVNNENGYFFKN